MIIQWKWPIDSKVERVCEALWTEVCNTVKEVVIKANTNEKKCKKEKWLSEEAWHTADKRREVKSKGERERYL